MDVLPEFELLRPRTLAEVHAALAAHPGARLVGGGTDLVVNLRRGIGDPPPALVDVNGVEELARIEAGGDPVRIGASVTVGALAAHPGIAEAFPVLAEAAGAIAGPTHRHMGTVGGNLCLDTRCIYYNQSAWWRGANDYCLKYAGTRCHVAPRSTVCYATFSADLPPALAVLGASVAVSGPEGTRAAPVGALYTGDGERYLALAPGEIVTAVHVPRAAAAAAGLRSAYAKVRVRRSIEYPLAGCAVAMATAGDEVTGLRVAFTGTNPWPVQLEGLEALTGRPLDAAGLETLAALVRRQVMAMRTTFTSGHYRRRVAGVLARRLVERLYAAR